MTLLRSLVVVVLTAAAAACGSSPSLPDSEADYGGTLTGFMMSEASLGAPRRVLVQRDGSTTPPDSKIVQVGSTTRLYRVGRGGLSRASADDLAVGDRLLVWTTGVELRSYPGQVVATRVHIIRQDQPGFD